jgi:hypothetical protein
VVHDKVKKKNQKRKIRKEKSEKENTEWVDFLELLPNRIVHWNCFMALIIIHILEPGAEAWQSVENTDSRGQSTTLKIHRFVRNLSTM